MKDSLGYILRGSGKGALACAQIAQIAEKARKGDPFLAHTPIPPEAVQGADPATQPAGRTFGLCGAPDPATAGALKCAADFLEGRGRATREGPRPLREVIRGIYRELHEEIAPALRTIAKALGGAEWALPAPGTILARAGAVAGSEPRHAPPPPPAPVYGPAVRVYEALWALWRAEPHRTRDLYDLAALAAVDKASKGRIGPASLSKLLSTLCSARCAHRLPGRGRFVLHEPTAERRAALSIARRGA